MNLENVMTLNDYADEHELDYPKLRRMARKNEFNEPFKFGNTWFIDATATAPVIPERATRTRNDGRSRFVVYIDRDTDECERIADIVGIDNVVDLRVVRAARKLAAAATTADDEQIVMHGVPMREMPDGALVVDVDDVNG